MDGTSYRDLVPLTYSNSDSQDAGRAGRQRDWRDEAVADEARSSILAPLALLWQSLTGGACRVADTFFTSTRCYVVTTELAGRGRPPIGGRRLEIVERILSGSAQKAVAIDLGLAASTVASEARAGLGSLGISGRPSRAHPVLMLAAKAARSRDLGLLGSLSVVGADASLRMIGIARADMCLLGVLPDAELTVLRRVVEGHSHEDIARERGTSVRTIANQLAAVSRRLEVSGRNDLVHRLFAESPSMGRPSAPLEPVLALRTVFGSSFGFGRSVADCAKVRVRFRASKPINVEAT